MVQFSNGFTWSDVYHMPIYLRRFYFNKLRAITNSLLKLIEIDNNNYYLPIGDPIPVKVDCT